MAEKHANGSGGGLLCRRCTQLLTNPVTCNCGHLFCPGCVRDRDGRCPECGNTFDDHDNDHRNPPRKRVRYSSYTSTGKVLCSRHQSPLNLYCCTDKMIICALCAEVEHRGHTIGCVREERRMTQEELKRIQTKSAEILKSQKRKCKNLKKMIEHIQDESKQTTDFCESVLVSVINSLQNHFLTLRKMIGAQEEAAVAQVLTSDQALETRIEEMDKSSTQLDLLADTQNDIYFLQKWPSLQKICEEGITHCLSATSSYPALPFELTKRSVETLGKRLQEFCNEEFASVFEMGNINKQSEMDGETDEEDQQEEENPSVTKSDVTLCVTNHLLTDQQEPTTRAEFLHYACCLTLDPNTAHQDLLVSAGDTVVEVRPQGSKNLASRTQHQERFLQRRQLLCRESLQNDRCYYEVEVKGDKAEIGLAYKGMDRKSRKKHSAFGGNANSWSLDRSLDYSVSHNNNSVKLTKEPQHHTIGVYLKFKEGSLTFYEVSDTMIFLYKESAVFTEPLYPGFWLGDKCRIKICDLSQEKMKTQENENTI